MSQENAIVVKNLTKRYKDFCLDNISFEIPYGTIVGFIGENGAGKTTTIKSLLGLCQIESGEIELLGNQVKRVKEDAEYKEHIGVVFDECNFPQELFMGDVGKIMKSIYKTWDSVKFENYVKQFELPKNKKVKELSKGMKMKLSIAVALSHDSRVLILDEATSGLDPIIRNEILDIFRDFVLDEKHAIFLSSHITSDIEKVADYIMLIHKGKLLFKAGKDELIYNYAIVKCSKEQAESIPTDIIVGRADNAFETSILINDKKRLTESNFFKKCEEDAITPVIDRANIEDIMLYMVKSK